MAMAGMRAGRIGPVAKEEKFTLLNSDEHIGVMRKMGRDISEARPDITHQVGVLISFLASEFGAALAQGKGVCYHEQGKKIDGSIVPPHPPRQPLKQSRPPPDLYPHRLQHPSPRQSHRPSPPNIQTLLRSHGPTVTPSLNPVCLVPRETP